MAQQAMIESEVLTEPAITNAVLTPRDQRVPTHLYYMLVLLLEGSAQRLVEHAGDGEGLLSWHRLVAEYELATTGRESAFCLWCSRRPSRATCGDHWTTDDTSAHAARSCPIT